MRITDSDPTQKEFLAETTPARGETGYEAAQMPFPPTPPALRQHSAGTPPALRRHSAGTPPHSAALRRTRHKWGFWELVSRFPPS
eukprot:gene16656-biopygen5284